MAQPFSSSHIPSSSCVPRRPPPSAFSPPTRTSASHAPVYRPRRRAVAAAASLHLGPGEIAELARNKVLIAATVASAIGQLSKPFTSGKKWGAGGAGFDAKTAFRSGGMPSTHSAVRRSDYPSVPYPVPFVSLFLRHWQLYPCCTACLGLACYVVTWIACFTPSMCGNMFS
jgi:hypothetical protein